MDMDWTTIQKSTMFEAGKLLNKLFSDVKAQIVPGVNLDEVDTYVSAFLRLNDARSALRMLGFPGYMSYAIDTEVIQQPAMGRIIKEDNLISLDMTMYYKGFFVDKAVSFVVPPAHYTKRYLVTSVEACLKSGIAAVRPNVQTSWVGGAIQGQANYLRMKVCRELYGHTIGENHHMKPLIPNFDNGSDEVIKEDTFVAVEPIIFYDHYKLNFDKVGVKSQTLCAHAEETVYVGKDGVEMVTC